MASCAAVDCWPAAFDLVRQWYQPQLEQRYVMRWCGPPISISCSASRPTIPSRTQFLTDLTLGSAQRSADEAGTAAAG